MIHEQKPSGAAAQAPDAAAVIAVVDGAATRAPHYGWGVF